VCTCLQNHTNGVLRCGDVADKVAFFMTLTFRKVQNIKTEKNQKWVLQEKLC